MQFEYDGIGNMVASKSSLFPFMARTYTYDTKGLATSVQRGAHGLTFEYDQDGAVIKRTSLMDSKVVTTVAYIGP